MKATRRQIINRILWFIAIAYYIYKNLVITFKQFFGYKAKKTTMELYNLKAFDSFINKKFGFGVSNMSTLKNSNMMGNMNNVKYNYFKLADIFNTNKTKTILPWVDYLDQKNTFLSCYKSTPMEKWYKYGYNSKQSRQRFSRKGGWFIKRKTWKKYISQEKLTNIRNKKKSTRRTSKNIKIGKWSHTNLWKKNSRLKRKKKTKKRVNPIIGPLAIKENKVKLKKKKNSLLKRKKKIKEIKKKLKKKFKPFLRRKKRFGLSYKWSKLEIKGRYKGLFTQLEGVDRFRRLGKLQVRRKFKRREKGAHKTRNFSRTPEKPLNTKKTIRKYPYIPTFKPLSPKKTAIGRKGTYRKKLHKRKCKRKLYIRKYKKYKKYKNTEINFMIKLNESIKKFNFLKSKKKRAKFLKKMNKMVKRKKKIIAIPRKKGGFIYKEVMVKEKPLPKLKLKSKLKPKTKLKPKKGFFRKKIKKKKIIKKWHKRKLQYYNLAYKQAQRRSKIYNYWMSKIVYVKPESFLMGTQYKNSPYIIPKDAIKDWVFSVMEWYKPKNKIGDLPEFHEHDEDLNQYLVATMRDNAWEGMLDIKPWDEPYPDMAVKHYPRYKIKTGTRMVLLDPYMLRRERRAINEYARANRTQLGGVFRATAHAIELKKDLDKQYKEAVEENRKMVEHNKIREKFLRTPWTKAEYLKNVKDYNSRKIQHMAEEKKACENTAVAVNKIIEDINFEFAKDTVKTIKRGYLGDTFNKNNFINLRKKNAEDAFPEKEFWNKYLSNKYRRKCYYEKRIKTSKTKSKYTRLSKTFWSKYKKIWNLIGKKKHWDRYPGRWMKRTYTKHDGLRLNQKNWGFLEWVFGFKNRNSILQAALKSKLLTNYWGWILRRVYSILRNKYTLKFWRKTALEKKILFARKYLKYLHYNIKIFLSEKYNIIAFKLTSYLIACVVATLTYVHNTIYGIIENTLLLNISKILAFIEYINSWF